MAIIEISGDQTFQVASVKILIYGDPGVGKSTFALSGKNPVLLDFDNGSHRAGNRTGVKILRIERWADVIELINNGDRYLQPYDTVVIDTVGTCLDYLAQSLIEQNPKNGTSHGGLSITGWGALKSGFTMFVRSLEKYGKDVVMIAHGKEEKGERDVRIQRPDISGGSYGTVMRMADFVGFMYTGEGDRRLLNFNPTERSHGKNSAKFPILHIPNFKDEPLFLAGKIEEMKTRLSGMTEQDVENRKIVASAKAGIDKLTTLVQLNDALAKLPSVQEPILSQIKSVLYIRSKELGFVYDKATASFINNPPATPAQPSAPVPAKEETPDPTPPPAAYVKPKPSMNLEELLSGSKKSNGAFVENDFE